MSAPHRPLCPCCMQAFSSSILAGEAHNNDNNNKDADVLRSPFMLCGTCAPSDVERALANKANEKDSDVPPIVWFLTPAEIQRQTQKILQDTEANLNTIATIPLDQVTFDNTVAKLMTPPNYKTNPALVACKFLQHCKYLFSPLQYLLVPDPHQVTCQNGLQKQRSLLLLSNHHLSQNNPVLFS